MELTGKVTKILPIQTGQSARGEWKKQEFIVETPGNFPKSVCLFMWGDTIDSAQLKEGEEITASIEIESREYNGKYYTNVKAWRINRPQAAAQMNSPQEGNFASANAPAPTPPPMSEPRLVSNDESDDLPF